ncbi:nuclear factor erythroid 2-related factor 2a [Festucalex cinctus]
MMMEMEVMHSGQQDTDLIDILWRQDIDLGARREVFDYSHRQKEHELQRQQELAEEKRLHLLREQEKALLAQLQLDEETGEYVPRPPPSDPLRSATTPLEAAQDVSFSQQSAEPLSFDECLQLIAETFPLEENEDASVCLDSSAASVASNSSSVAMMSPEQPSLAPLTLSPDPLTASQPQEMFLDIEQAWMELLSLPELQCLSQQLDGTVETVAYPLPNSTEAQDPNYSFYSMSSPVQEKNNLNICPTGFMNTFEGSVPNVSPARNGNQIKPEVPQLNTHFNLNSFCDTFYPDTMLEESSSQQELEGNERNILSDVQNLYSLSPGDTFERGRHSVSAEVPDLDSGLSSPHACSPGKSMYGDEGFDGSDSDMEEMDQNPGSAKSDYSEMFSLNFQPDDNQRAFPLSTLAGQHQTQHDETKQGTTDPAEDNGHSASPFTKDKRKRRSDLRLSRDEQRAKALKIPFGIDMIINLPVDDYNELISKNQLNEAQLALIRDIRRRGKNKVAAQNCRKRKMENIVGLENDLDSLKEEKERQLGEKSRNVSSLREMKRKLNSLYLEVFSMLRDEDGNAISPADFSLQQSTEGSVFLVPRTKKTLIKS